MTGGPSSSCEVGVAPTRSRETAWPLDGRWVGSTGPGPRLRGPPHVPQPRLRSAEPALEACWACLCQVPDGLDWPDVQGGRQLMLGPFGDFLRHRGVSCPVSVPPGLLTDQARDGWDLVGGPFRLSGGPDGSVAHGFLGPAVYLTGLAGRISMSADRSVASWAPGLGVCQQPAAAMGLG